MSKTIYHALHYVGFTAALSIGCGASLDRVESSGPSTSVSDPMTSTSQRYPLTVSLAGSGQGSILSAGGGTIDCGNRCIAQIPRGQSVTLVSQENPSSLFIGWEGACSGTSRSCTLTADQPLSVVARFQANPTWRTPYVFSEKLQGLWVRSSGEVWVTTSTTLQRWNGGTWSIIDRRTKMGENFGSSLIGRPDGVLFASLRLDYQRQGSLCESSGSGTYCPIYNYAEHSMVQYTPPSTRILTAITTESTDPPAISITRSSTWMGSTVLSVTCNTLARLDGTQWKMQTLPNCMQGIGGTSDADYWMVGTGGVILRGGSMTAVPSGTSRTLYAVWGSAPNQYFAVGDGGVITHYDGVRWTVSHTASRTLRGIWGSGADDVWAVGDRGLLLHYDGSRWSEVPSGTIEDLRAVYGTSPLNVWVIGDRSLLTTGS